MRREVSVFVVILLWGRFVGLSQVVSDVDPPAFVSGTVTDIQSGEPIPDVNILIVGTRIGSTTDVKGIFSIGPLRPGLYALQFSHVSYGRIRDTRYLKPGDITTYDIRLAKRSIMLEEVEIIGEHPRSSNLWKGTSGRVFTRKDIEGTGVRRLTDLLRLMAPGAFFMEMGPDLIIDFNRSTRRTTRTAFRDYPQTNPLIILNGMRIGKSPQSLSLLIKPEEIDEIVVLKGTEAHMYGYEGRDGVILVETTPEPPPTELSLFEKLLYVTAVVGASLLVSLLLF